MAIQIIDGKAVETDPNYDQSSLFTDSMGRKWIRNSQGVTMAEYKPIALPPTIKVPTLDSAPTVSSPELPSLSFDPLLSPASILKKNEDAVAAAKAPVDPSKFIVPGATDLLTQGLNEQLNINKASAQSDFLARGMTGGSTEVQTLTRDLPNAANKALAEGTVKLLTAAYPLAMADKQSNVDALFKSASLATQIRSIIGDEAFKGLSLKQQAEIANQEATLRTRLAQIDMEFQSSIKNAELAFQMAENDKDRKIAEAQYQQLLEARKKARTNSFFSGLTTIIGTGVGAYYGGPAGAAAGASAGKTFGDMFIMD